MYFVGRTTTREKTESAPRKASKGHKTMRLTIRSVVLTVCVLLGCCVAATAQSPAATPPAKHIEELQFLRSLTGIQQWASDLEAALRNRGDKIDQRKAKSQLLPGVIAIQKSLSDLEDINTKVVADCGTSIESLNREKMAVDLRALEFKLRERYKKVSGMCVDKPKSSAILKSRPPSVPERRPGHPEV